MLSPDSAVYSATMHLHFGDHELALTTPSGDDDLLLIEATYHPGSKPPPMHFHPQQTEKITLLEGRLQAVIGGQSQLLETGSSVEIAPGVPHKMWNPFGQVARTRWETRPALRTAELLQLLHRTPGPLRRAARLYAYRDVFQLAVLPTWIQGPLLYLLWILDKRWSRREG
jgi:mannose-6-phosphate isomerase-like protein (cupin superfamily)